MEIGWFGVFLICVAFAAGALIGVSVALESLTTSKETIDSLRAQLRDSSRNDSGA